MNQTVPKNSIIQSRPVRRHSSDFFPFLSLLWRWRWIRWTETIAVWSAVVMLPPEFVAIPNWVHHVLCKLDPLLLFLSLLSIWRDAWSREWWWGLELGSRKRLLEAEGEEDDGAGDRHGGGQNHSLWIQDWTHIDTVRERESWNREDEFLLPWWVIGVFLHGDN